MISTIQRVKTTSLRTQVYAQLKKQLINGVWKTGEKLPPEHELCIMFGVSRVTVRAALQQLEILGLVETKQGGGTFVTGLSNIGALFEAQRNQDIYTVLEYRKMIEKGAIGLVCEKVTADGLAELEKTYERLLAGRGNLAEFTAADLAFHLKIAQLTDNPIISKVYDFTYQILSVAMADIVLLTGEKMGLKYHREIIDALRAHDKAECERLMEEHIAVTILMIKEQDDRGINEHGDA
jgi:GntR family transcriptional repressor for pyruvate dehydrogenase complex